MEIRLGLFRYCSLQRPWLIVLGIQCDQDLKRGSAFRIIAPCSYFLIHFTGFWDEAGEGYCIAAQGSPCFQSSNFVMPRSLNTIIKV